MIELNKKELKILAIANTGKVTHEDCLRFYRTAHHIYTILRRLCKLGYIVPLESGSGFVLTGKGKETLGIEIDSKLSQYK